MLLFQAPAKTFSFTFEEPGNYVIRAVVTMDIDPGPNVTTSDVASAAAILNVGTTSG